MKLRRIIAVALTLALCTFGGGWVPPPEEPQAGYLFYLAQDVPMLLSAEGGIAPVPYAPGYYKADSLSDLQPWLDAGLVKYAVPDAPLELLSDTTGADPGALNQWYLNALGMESAWQSGLDGSGTVVAVIDSGLVQNHEDLDYTAIAGRNFLGTVNDPAAWADNMGHGTLVAGILAAQTGNGIGVAGLTDGIKLLPLRCFSGSGAAADSGSGMPSTIISALGYAIEQKVDVINMSFGGTNKATLQILEPVLQRAAQADILLVAAAGNSGNSTYHYPAAFDCVIGVGNTNIQNLVYGTSQRNDSVFVTAPGSNIYGLGYQSATSYRSDSGTSMAAPMVSALAAMAKQKDSAINTQGFQALLKDCAVDAGTPGYDTAYGWGIVSAARLEKRMAAPQSILYECNGGQLPQTGSATWSESYQIGQGENAVLPTPQRDGYDFTGWYLDDSCTGQALGGIPPGSVSAVTVFAGWKESDAAPEITKLQVMGIEAVKGQGDSFTAQLPYGTDLSTLGAGAITVTLNPLNSSSNLEKQSDGVWHITVRSRTYTLALTLAPMAVPTPVAGATAQTGSATPPSYDGITPGAPYRADVSSWFTGATAYRVELAPEYGTATFAGGQLTYAPTDAASGRQVPLKVWGQNTGGESATPVTVTVTIGAVPTSDSKITPTTYGYDKHTQSAGIPLNLFLYGNGLSRVRNGETTLVAGQDYALGQEPLVAGSPQSCTLHHAFLSRLSVGTHRLDFVFEKGRTPATAEAHLLVTITDSSTTDVGGGTIGGGGGGGGGMGGGAPAPQKPPLELLKTPNAAISYVLEANGIGVLSVETQELRRMAQEKAAQFDLSGAKGAIGLSLPQDALQALSNAEVTLLLPQGGLVLPAGALATMAPSGFQGGLLLTITPDGKPMAARSATTQVQPSYTISLTVGGKPVPQSALPVTLRLPHWPQGGQNPANLAIACLDAKGAASALPTVWNEKAGCLEAKTTQLSRFTIITSAWVNPFLDVSENSWYYEAVQYVNQQGLFGGVAADSFQPQAPVTRAMLVTVLARSKGQDTTKGATWDAVGLAWAKESGISDGENPGAPITREQLAAMLYRLAGSPSVPNLALTFTDKGEISDWAADAIRWAADRGILTGKDANRLDPQGGATRAEVAAVLHRYLGSSQIPR